MHYIIYPDTLFLENLICNLCFLFLMKSLFFPNASGKRILLAGGLTALCNTFASILFFHSIWILKIGVLLPAAGLMVTGSMDVREPERILYLFYQIVLWTLIFGGVLQEVGQWRKISPLFLCVLALIFAVVFWAAEKLFRSCRRQNGCMKDVVLYFHGKSYHFRGFADTGNQLFDPVSHEPVSLISGEAWEMMKEGEEEEPLYYPIPYKSVGNPGGMLKGIRIDFMVVGRGSSSRVIERPVIAVTEQSFAGIFHYSVLLHNEYC